MDFLSDSYVLRHVQIDGWSSSFQAQSFTHSTFTELNDHISVLLFQCVESSVEDNFVSFNVQNRHMYVANMVS